MKWPMSTTTNIEEGNKVLFWGCFIALVTTAFSFISRMFLLGTWGEEFGLDDAQAGRLAGIGIWPFAVSIIGFSLVIDRIGYKVCALGNGTVEAFINPVVATMYNKEKTKWLNILHAGWPGGLVLAGMIIIFIDHVPWWVKVGLIAIPAVVYFMMLIYFPPPKISKITIPSFVWNTIISLKNMKILGGGGSIE